jgi:hypothetical protein
MELVLSELFEAITVRIPSKDVVALCAVNWELSNAIDHTYWERRARAAYGYKGQHQPGHATAKWFRALEYIHDPNEELHECDISNLFDTSVEFWLQVLHKRMNVDKNDTKLLEGLDPDLPLSDMVESLETYRQHGICVLELEDLAENFPHFYNNYVCVYGSRWWKRNKLPEELTIYLRDVRRWKTHARVNIAMVRGVAKEFRCGKQKTFSTRTYFEQVLRQLDTQHIVNKSDILEFFQLMDEDHYKRNKKTALSILSRGTHVHIRYVIIIIGLQYYSLEELLAIVGA